MDTKRGDDAQDHAPKPTRDKEEAPDDKQDARNYETNKGAIDVGDMSSANDEGAN